MVDWYGTVEVRVDDLKNRLNVTEQRLAEFRDEVERLWEGPDAAAAEQMTRLDSALEKAAAAATDAAAAAAGADAACRSSGSGGRDRNASGGGGNSSSAAPAAVSQQQAVVLVSQQQAMVPVRGRTPPCPKCRGMELVCPVCDRDMLFLTDYAQISWGFVNAARTLISYFTYADITVNAATLQNSALSSPEASLYLGADGTFSIKVLNVLILGLSANHLEMVYHRTLSNAYCVLAVRCLECNYCCSLAFSKHNKDAWKDLCGSLARWLGVDVKEVPSSACYVHGQQALFGDAQRGAVRTAVGAPAPSFWSLIWPLRLWSLIWPLRLWSLVWSL